MNEAKLTKRLVENLCKGGIKKIVNYRQSTKALVFREIGNEQCIADIFITLESNNKNTRSRSIAIEVKVKDWERGLYQAWRYNMFAEKSYLAVYASFIDRVDLSEFEKHNVGLISYDEKGIEVIKKPKVLDKKINLVVNRDEKDRVYQRLISRESFQPVF